MENQNIILKLSRLLPSSFSSSCQLRAVAADVAESSVSIAKTQKIPHRDSDDSRFSKPAKGPKCPRASPVYELKKKHHHPSAGKSLFPLLSSSSNSGFFSSSSDDDEEENKAKKDAETDAFFSLSSNSGDSFRFKRGDGEETATVKMKTIKEKSLDLAAVSGKSGGGGDTKKSSHGNNNATKKCGDKLGQENNWPLIAGDHHAYYDGSKRASDVNGRSRGRRTRMIKKKSSRSSSTMMIGESRAVEKRSVDPRGDFRASMVEMIVEKQMVSARDLERLLLCFLSLNDVSYHEMIFVVFSEICETLFSN